MWGSAASIPSVARRSKGRSIFKPKPSCAASFFKWAGGKTSLLPDLLPHVPHRLTSYYEPFLGGGALFFGICARTTSFSAHLSDTNEELINAYRVIKESPDELISFLSRFQKEYDSAPDQSAYFYKKRD